jgi:Cu(I)/Ag(I) efflux system membrane protein CusA/SilA
MEITRTVEGRERYGVRVRYPQELRDQPEDLAEILVPVRQEGTGALQGATQIPLGQIASMEIASGPMSIKTEGAFPTAWVFVDVETDDLGGYVQEAREMVEAMVSLPPGYTMEWSGQYEFMQRAQARLGLVVPATLLIIAVLLFMNFKRVGEPLIVMGSLPFALVGGVLIMALLGYNWSVAAGVGFIALAGVAAETAVIMLLYLNHAWDDRIRRGETTRKALYDAVMEGAVLRVRPKIMTVTTIILGLLPILWGHGTGAGVMKRIAAPMVGGMVSATVLTLVVIPVIYFLWQGAVLARAEAGAGVESGLGSPELRPRPAYGD